jgi:ABC-type hemin transport system ATPase subunit
MKASIRRWTVERLALVDRGDLQHLPRTSTGRLTVIIGPNGAGKSTLLKALSGGRPPSTATIGVDGVDLRRMCVLELAARRAVMPQAMILALPFTALEVAFLGASVPGLAARSPERRVAERLNGLSEAARAQGKANRSRPVQAKCLLSGVTAFLVILGGDGALDFGISLILTPRIPH